MISKIPMIRKEELIGALPLATEYTEIKIPKRRGGYRTLLVPSPELKKIQGKILRYLRKIFDQGWLGIYGLRSGSYIDHAKTHSGSRFIFFFDLEDAFPSVDVSELRKILINRFIHKRIYALEAREFTDLILQLTTFNQTIPQGAPTSPFLFWLMLNESGLFEKLKLHSSLPRGYKISCYSDGFCISGRKLLRFETKEKIFKCLEEFGFRVNPKKVHQFDCRQGAPLICGIRVDGKGRISLPKKKIRKWRGIIHRASFNTGPEMMKKIEGFIASLRPIYGERLPPQIEKPYLIFEISTKQTRLTNWM